MPAPIIRPPTKICKDCELELNKEEHFYKGGYNSYQSKCKICFNLYSAINIKKRRAKQTKQITCGFFNMPEETQKDIKEKIGKGGKIKAIAREFDIPYGSLYLWHKKGYTKII